MHSCHASHPPAFNPFSIWRKSKKSANAYDPSWHPLWNCKIFIWYFLHTFQKEAPWKFWLHKSKYDLDWESIVYSFSFYSIVMEHSQRLFWKEHTLIKDHKRLYRIVRVAWIFVWAVAIFRYRWVKIEVIWNLTYILRP